MTVLGWIGYVLRCARTAIAAYCLACYFAWKRGWLNY